MATSYFVILIFCLYIGLLWLLALWTERAASKGYSLVNNPIVYSLSLAVYCSSWTFFGSVGLAAHRGPLFLAIYLGPTLMIVLWPRLLQKMVRLKSAYRITSIADFISARYDKSDKLAASVTVVAMVGTIPYVALQFKSILSTFSVITGRDGQSSAWMESHVGVIVVGLMILFTIMFGVRRMDPTERHEGMVMAVAVESIIKLVALVAVGIFVVYSMFGGFGDLLANLEQHPTVSALTNNQLKEIGLITWFSYFVLSANAIICLPRQFHIAVVENQSENHLRWAIWLFPLYLFLINLFIHPIALGGLLSGYSPATADTFVLRLPLDHGRRSLALLVFIGGFSAATSMIMICSMTMSTMISNHLLLPLADSVPRLNVITHRLLQTRWMIVAVFIVSGYGFERMVGRHFPLADLGLISFCAILQLAPSVFGGLLWKEGNQTGALWGLWAGFTVWAYTLVIPILARVGILDMGLLVDGPWGWSFLRPEALFLLDGWDPIAHAAFWSLLANLTLYIVGSLLREPASDSQGQREAFMDAIERQPVMTGVPEGEPASPIEKKFGIILDIFDRYFPPEKARELTESAVRDARLEGRTKATIPELAELHRLVEKLLAGSIGAAMANRALIKSEFFTSEEAEALKAHFAEILTNLRATPRDLIKKIDYYREREMLIQGHAEELAQKIRELEEQMNGRRTAEEQLKESEERYRLAIEGSSDGIVVVDEGRLVWGNSRLPEIFGYGSPEEVIGRPLALIIHPEDREWVLDIARRRQAGLDAPTRYDFKGIRKDGTSIYIAVSATTVNYQGRMMNLVYLRDVTRRRMAEEEIHNLSRRLIESIEDERRRLAANLHDEFGQTLTALYLGIESARKALPETYIGIKTTLDKQIAVIERMAETIRNIAGDLRPDMLDHLGLVPTVRWYVNELRQTLPRCEVIFQAMGFKNRKINPNAEITLYRVLQEATNNIVKHAGADRVRISLTYSHPTVIMVISDNGCGFSPESVHTKVGPARTGIGLSSMKERVAAVNGVIDIRSSPAHGTTIRVTV